MKRGLAGIMIVAVLLLVANDARFHFDEELLLLKREHRSDQRNWNAFYPQQFVFEDSPIRYADDLRNMLPLITPGSLLLSDIATSYYAATELPVYVVNVHRHQGRAQRPFWRQFLNDRYFCYQEFEENRELVDKHLKAHPNLDYVIVNHDRLNGHRRRDCLAFRSETLSHHLPRNAKLLYSGRYLDLYQL